MNTEVDIVERLQFDAMRTEIQFSKGVASNIEAAIAEISKLRAERDAAARDMRERCARLIQSGAGMADLIDQQELDQQAAYILGLPLMATDQTGGAS